MENLNSDEIKTEIDIKENYISWLEKMMFFISHKLRQPVTTILGLSNVINSTSISKLELKKVLLFIRQCALTLDKHTGDITRYTYQKMIKLTKGHTTKKNIS
jgi:hypothetical protein